MKNSHENIGNDKAAKTPQKFLSSLTHANGSLPPYFIDTTLRDGEQAPGVVFSLADKIRIAEYLDLIGIPEVEVGIPAMGENEIYDIKRINSVGFRFKTLAWCRANKNDILSAAKSGSNGVHLSFPVSQILLESMNKTPQWVLEQLRNLITVALYSFDYVTVGAQDASRAEKSFLLEFAAASSFYGASRIRLADTVGMLNPLSTYEMVSSVRKIVADLPIEIHAHNDLGMATANTLAAYFAGANCLSTTINGLGERAGNAPLEEVAMALEFSSNIKCGLDTTKFQEASDFVSKVSNRRQGDSKPITGKMVYCHESGIHTHSLLTNRSTYQLIPAEKIGRKEVDFIIGKHSGKAGIEHFLKEAHLYFDEDLLSKLLIKVKEMAQRVKRSISKSEFFDLYFELYNKRIVSETSNI